jgi:hypothetical protein
MTKYPQRLSIIPAISAATDYYRSNHTDSGEDGQDSIRAEPDLDALYKAFLDFKAASHPIRHGTREEAMACFDAVIDAWEELNDKMDDEVDAHCPDGKT